MASTLGYRGGTKTLEKLEVDSHLLRNQKTGQTREVSFVLDEPEIGR